MILRCQLKRWFWLAIIFAALPIRADAHLVTSGLGPVYDGMEHLLLSPEQWIMVAGLALWAGLNGAAAGRAVLFTFPCAWLAGGGLGHFIHVPLSPLLPGVALLMIGGLLAADLKSGRNLAVSIASASGLLQGYLNGVSFGAIDGLALTLLGTAMVAFVIVAVGAALAVNIEGWRRIAVRVAGSWMAAIGILFVGWAIRWL